MEDGGEMHSSSSTLSSSCSVMSSSVSSICSLGEEGRMSSRVSPKPVINFSHSLPGMSKQQKAAGYSSLWQQARPESQLQFSASYQDLDIPACQIKFSTEDEVKDNIEKEEEAGREDRGQVRATENTYLWSNKTMILETVKEF